MDSSSSEKLPQDDNGNDSDNDNIVEVGVAQFHAGRSSSATVHAAPTLGKLKVYDRRGGGGGRTADRFRQSLRHCDVDDTAVRAVVDEHGMSVPGTECCTTFSCSDDDPYLYVLVEVLQLVADWTSEHRHFANVLQVSVWSGRDNLAGLLRSYGGEEIVQSTTTGSVAGEILYDILKHHRPSLYAAVVFGDMSLSQVEVVAIRLLEAGFELLASRFDDHVLEARSPAGRDVLKCVFHVLAAVIADYAYVVDFLSTAMDVGGLEDAIRSSLRKAVASRRCRRGGVVETAGGDVCQKLFDAAVRTGNSELARVLLQLPQFRRYVDVDSVIDSSTGDSALHLACRMGSTLIDHNFDDHLRWEAADLERTAEFDGGSAAAASLAYPGRYHRFVAAAATAAADGCRSSPALDAWKVLAMLSQMQKLQHNVRFDDYIELTQLLIRHGADVNATNAKGETALHVAASCQLHGSALVELYALRSGPAGTLEPGVVLAQNYDLLAALKTLRENSLQEKDESETLFRFIACELFTPSTIHQLNPIVRSYFDNVASLIRSLLQAGADVNVTTPADETALLIAARNAARTVAFCRQMCTSSALDAREGAAAVAKFLRADIFTVVKELLIGNADWRIGTSNGVGALDIALSSNQTDLLVELVCQGAELADSWPQYLVRVFASEDQGVAEETLRTLSSSIGVTVDVRDEAGQTALHVAARQGLSDVVSNLIRVGADVAAVDGDGKTALEIAQEHGCPKGLCDCCHCCVLN